jgi:protein tyrosine/serine phosphatase
VGNAIPNLHRVSTNLYRSAQPTAAGFRVLDTQSPLDSRDQPVRTVLSLRAIHGDEHLRTFGSSLRLKHVRFNALFPRDRDVIQCLKFVNTPHLQPVLVHCLRGADRTGAIIALYRMVFEHWPLAEALHEMTDGGYGFNPLCRNLLHYIRETDVVALRAQVARQRPGSNL